MDMVRPVLVVDDEADIRQLLVEILSDAGYTVVTAVDGREALQQVATCVPALILLDLQMPRLDGWSVVHALRERATPVPILIMTAATQIQRTVGELRVSGGIAKPFDIAAVVRAVRATCLGKAT
jgi:DNA-binding response OmpR family regulator